MKRQTEGGKEEKRKVWLSDICREWRKRKKEKKQKGRWTEGDFHPFCLVSFAGRAVAHFCSLSSPWSCHPLVISRYKILRISSGHRGCSQMLLNQQQSTQSLNKCLIKPLQRCSLVKNSNAMKKRLVFNFSPSSWLLSWTEYGTVWHAVITQTALSALQCLTEWMTECLVTPKLIIYLVLLRRFLPIKSLQHLLTEQLLLLLLLGLPRSKFCSPLKLPSNISI